MLTKFLKILICPYSYSEYVIFEGILTLKLYLFYFLLGLLHIKCIFKKNSFKISKKIKIKIQTIKY